MAFYVCDGSSSEKKLGAGIIRTKGFIKTYYTFTTETRSHQSVGAECFAIHKVTELIRKYNDKRATVITDFQHMIDLFYGRRIPVRPVPPWVIRALCNLKELRSAGIEIILRHQSDLVHISDFAASHRLSRAYKRSGERIMKESESLSAVAEVRAGMNIKARPHDDIFEENMVFIQRTNAGKQPVLDAGSGIFKTFIFQRISLTEWGVFDENLCLIEEGSSLVSAMNEVFYKLSPSAQTISVNEHAMYLLQTEDQQSEDFLTLVSRMMLFPIVVFEDFLLSIESRKLQEVERFGPANHYIRRELG
ncbi:hypothetical protein [Alteribacter keqinensis]|uniref:Uncharacterized protein n=1 Tax=Alteribacter keqinensis TaxID=2483800 RepID=A0A3M7TXH7_9BACI|nr:hypothetical protein [Alteribacter keqinensis]RNA69979.1 hypothetical protein EBO34_08620 [Alteribacter keqinensis]